MNDNELTVWTIIKKFLLGWLAVGGILTVIGCVKYKDYIFTVVSSNIWAVVDAVMPILIIIFALLYIIRSVFR